MRCLTETVVPLALLACSPVVTVAQAIARPVDPTPLARPEAVATLHASAPVTLLQRLRQIVTTKGFTVVERDDDANFFAAERKDSGASKDYDRVLLWLERDTRDPLHLLHVHLLYGRFEDVWVASRRGVHRVRVDPDYEAGRIGAVRTAILALADSI